MIGTREWSTESYNIQVGCEHGCVYCYARYNALKRFKQIETVEEWEILKLLPKRIKKRWHKREGIIMFPTQHDITEKNITEYLFVLKKMLHAGNSVLIVSKPHVFCIEQILSECINFKEQVVFRFSIGSLNENELKIWEPYAPGIHERLECVEMASSQGFQTSISAEPLLTEDLDGFMGTLLEYNLESIWLGFMNYPEQRILIPEAHYQGNWRKSFLEKIIKKINTLDMAKRCEKYAKEYAHVHLKDGLRKLLR